MSPDRPASPRRRWLLPVLVVCIVGVLVGATVARGNQYTVELGPFALPANSTHETLKQPAPLAVALPVDGWLRGLSFDLVDGRGEPVPRGMLHHLNLMTPEHRELFSHIMLRLGAAGPETQPYSLPWFMGYRVHRGDSLLVVAMMHNPTPKGYQGVRVRVHLTMGPAWLRSLAIQPVYLDVMPPAGIHAYDLPPGRSTKSWEGRPAVAARLLAAGTHLHQYGTGLRLEDVSTGTVLWEVRPNVDAKGEVVSMPRRYFLPFGVPLVPDHLYRLTAEYDNPTGKVLEGGGMGALGGIVIPASGASWPRAERADSEYRYDVQVVTGGHMHHHHRPEQSAAQDSSASGQSLEKSEMGSEAAR